MVAYDANRNPIWANNCCDKGTAPYTLDMQADGNLVQYDANRNCIWASGTNE